MLVFSSRSCVYSTETYKVLVVCRHCCKHGGRSSEQDTISPLGELPSGAGRQTEQEKPHKLVGWAEPYRKLLGGSGQMRWYGLAIILNGHPMFRMGSPGQDKDRAGKSVGVYCSHPVVN